MECAACGHAMGQDAKFCSECGTPLPRPCTSCGSLIDPAAKFCAQCGTPTGVAGADRVTGGDDAVRKTVTVLFADLVGSTAFGERVDAESSRDVLADYHAMARRVIEEHGGHLNKFIGDGVMALFGVPETAEDDAVRAIRAGLALQSGFDPLRHAVADRHDAELGLRVGINTGEVVIAAGDDDVVGDALNTAARIEAACAPGQVLVGEGTRRLTRSAFDFIALGGVHAKGKSEPVATHQVVAAGADDEDVGAPFVGRRRELARLRQVFDHSVERRLARMATVVGSPGVGKTRLSREFCAGIEAEATVVEMRCRRSGTATFAPVADLLRAAADVGDDDAPDDVQAAVRELVGDLDDADRVSEILAGFLGAGPDRSTEEAFFAVRRLVESQARRRPIVLVVDDIQWAEPLFLDLLEHLAEWVGDAPTLLIALARPEIRDIRPSMSTEGRTVQAAIALEGLDADATAELAARLVGTSSLPPELVGRLPRSTEGNPLFVRELMRMLVDDGVIVERDGSWELTIDAEAVEVPPTIQSLLSARLDRMPADERRLVELASVVGSEFPLGAVQAISDQRSAESTHLRRALDRLRRRELVEPTGRYRGDEPVFRFHHVLIRDAAYRRLLKRVRAELHVDVGEWMQRTAAGLPGEHEVGIAFHFEQAYAYRRELSEHDDTTSELGRRAAALLRTAAQQAVEQDDIAAAGALAERAVACLGPDDPGLPGLLILGCEALLSLGDVGRSTELLAALHQVGGDARQEAWTTCFDAQLAVLTDPGGLHGVLQVLDAAAEELGAQGDDAGVAKARLVRASALARLGRIGDSESELDLALGAARAAGDRRRVAAVLGVAPIAALWGPSAIPRAGGRCLDVVRLLRITTASPSVEAVSTRCQAVLEALRGRFDIARAMLADARATVEELGLPQQLLETELYAGIVELLAGDPSAAAGALRSAYEGLVDMRIDADAGHAAAHLARALLRLGEVDEADALAGASDALAGQTPQTGIVARAVLAEVREAQGRFAEALELAQEAVEIAVATDLVIDHADANRVLARAAAGAGHRDVALAAEAAARELYEAKGAAMGALDAGGQVETRGSVDTDAPADRSTGGPAAVERSREPAPVEDAPFNRADASCREGWAQYTSGDLEGWRAHLADDVVFDDRRALVGGESAGRDTLIDRLWALSSASIEESRLTTVAARGERFVVQRHGVRTDDGVSWDVLAIYELGDDGRVATMVFFDPDDTASALDELDRRWYETLSPAEQDAVHVLLRWGRAAASWDLEAFDELMSDDFAGYGGREMRLGWMDRDRWLDLLRARTDVQGGDATHRIEAIEFLDPETLLMTFRVTGRDVTWETEWEERGTSVLQIRDGRVRRVGAFRAGDREGARRWAAALTAPSSPEPGSDPAFDSALRRLAVRIEQTMNDGSLADHIDELFEPDYERVDHRSVVGTGVVDTATYLENVPDFFERIALVPVARRGDRMLLHRASLRYADDRESEQLLLGEMSRAGKDRRTDVFDPDALDEAMSELDRRWFESLTDAEQHTVSVARRWLAAGLTWDLATFDDMMADDFRGYGGRQPRGGWADRAQWMKSLEARPDLQGPWETLHVDVGELVRPDVILQRILVAGHDRRWGNTWEESGCMVLQVTTDAKQVRRLGAFEADAYEEARAWARSLDSGGAADPLLDNLAGRVGARMLGAMNDGTLADRLDELFEPDWQRDDHRSVFSTGVLDRSDHADHAAVMEAHTSATPIAIRGDHLRLSRGITRLGGDNETGYLVLSEVSAAGRQRRVDLFDEDALDEAKAELDRRWAASLPPRQRRNLVTSGIFERAFRDHDVEALDRVLAPAFWCDERILVGGGVLDRATYLDQLPEGADVKGTSSRLYDIMRFAGPDVIVAHTVQEGTAPASGGGSQRPEWIVVEVADGLVHHLAIFDDDQRDVARDDAAGIAADFREDDPLWNHAARVLHRLGRRWRAGLGLTPELLADRFVWTAPGSADERVTAGVQEFLEQREEVRSTPLAVRGESALLEREEVAHGDGTETRLRVTLLDDADRLVRVDDFDGGAVDDALGQLHRSWRSTLPEPEQAMLRVAAEFGRAFGAQDRAGFERVFTPDFVAVEHHDLGSGQMDAEAYVASHRGRDDVWGPTRAVYDVVQIPAPDVLVIRSAIVTSRRDTDWEDVVWNVMQIADGRLARLEVYAEDHPGDPDPYRWARRRAEELAAHPSDDGVPANRATMAAERRARAAAGLRGDQVGPAVDSTEVVAIRGDRFCLSRLVAEAQGEEPRVERLSLLEVDERGDEQRALDFGPDALGEAIAELDSWWLDALDPDDRLAAETELRLQTALHPVDLDRVAGLLHPEFQFRDHQRLSIFGELAREEWLGAVADRGAVGHDTSLVREAKILGPDVVMLVQRTVGASVDGVEWERHGIVVARVVDGLIRSADVFELADRAVALELAQQLAGRRSRRG